MRKTRILIVEDENIVAKDIQNILNALGHYVASIVSTGNEALRKVEKYHPDLILMDIILQADFNGIETARRIRSHFDIPIVYLTAYSDEKTLEAAKYTEPFGYILKPINPKELQITIEIALYKHATKQKLERALHESQDRYHQLLIPA